MFDECNNPTCALHFRNDVELDDLIITYIGMHVIYSAAAPRTMTDLIRSQMGLSMIEAHWFTDVYEIGLEGTLNDALKKIEEDDSENSIERNSVYSMNHLKGGDARVVHLATVGSVDDGSLFDILDFNK